MHVGIFDLEHIKVIWGHSVHFSEKRAYRGKSKTAHCRTKLTTIWASEVDVACMLVFLTLNMLRSFGVIRCTFP